MLSWKQRERNTQRKAWLREKGVVKKIKCHRSPWVTYFVDSCPGCHFIFPSYCSGHRIIWKHAKIKPGINNLVVLYISRCFAGKVNKVDVNQRAHKDWQNEYFWYLQLICVISINCYMVFGTKLFQRKTLLNLSQLQTCICI